MKRFYRKKSNFQWCSADFFVYYNWYRFVKSIWSAINS